MAKAKKNKKSLSDKVRAKKRGDSGKINPFEVKINRQKKEVLGRKISKHDKGMPGLARSKAIKKRKETLLVEYQKRGKANKLLDKRFGENDPEMSAEDKMLQRFALERQRTHEKAGAFNLNEDEEELTHYGQSLSEIEKFEDPEVSDSEDDEDKGRIGAKLVGEEHFGGGILTKKGEGEESNKPWKQKMEELIAQSKKAKYDRQHEKEKALELTDQLDQQWKDLRSVMAASKTPVRSVMAASKTTKPKDAAAESSTDKKADDDYDIMVRELQFDLKAKGTDRLKSDEEIAKKKKVPTATLR